MKLDPNERGSMPDRDQGVTMECVFCSTLYPELKEKGCPYCRGEGIIFQPARMMTPKLSRDEIFRELAEFFRFMAEKNLDQHSFHEIYKLEEDEAKNLKDRAISLLKKAVIYGFDLKDTLIDFIHQLDEGSGLRE